MISLTWCHHQGKGLGCSSNPVHPNHWSNHFLHHIPIPVGCIRHFCNENDPSDNNFVHPASVKKLQLTGGRIGSTHKTVNYSRFHNHFRQIHRRNRRIHYTAAHQRHTLSGCGTWKSRPSIQVGLNINSRESLLRRENSTRRDAGELHSSNLRR